MQQTTLLQNEKKDKTKLVNSLKTKEKTLTAEIQRQKKLADQMNRQIENIIAEEARKAAELAAKEKNRTVPTTKGGYAMTNQEKNPLRRFRQTARAAAVPPLATGVPS